MNGLAWSTPDCANWEALWCFFGIAIVAFGATFFDDLNLSVESCSSALDERNICCQTHFVYMSSCFEVVECIENEGEGGEPVDVELGITDVCVVRFDIHVRIEFAGRFLSDLCALLIAFTQT